jgi:hypothetical protein
MVFMSFLEALKNNCPLLSWGGADIRWAHGCDGDISYEL